MMMNIAAGVRDGIGRDRYLRNMFAGNLNRQILSCRVSL
jgi:hypothetical protein